MREDFELETYRAHGVWPIMPDLAKCGPVLLAVVGRGVRAAVVLPVWEGKKWWSFGVKNCVERRDLGNVETWVLPNETVGYPRWDFSMFVF